MISLLKKNMSVIVKFEVLMTLFVLYILSPINNQIFRFLLRVTNVQYLTQENIIKFILHPAVIVVGIIVIFGITIVTIININAINIVYIASVNDTKINLMGLIKLTLKHSKIKLSVQNILLFIYVCILLPFAGLIYENPVLKKINIPNFILDDIFNSDAKFLIVLTIALILLVVTFYSIFTFFYMFNQQNNFIKALRKSIKLVKSSFKSLVKNLSKGGIILLILIVFSSILQYIMLQVTYSLGGGIKFIVISTLLLLIKQTVSILMGVIFKVIMLFYVAKIFYKFEKLPSLSFDIGKNIKLPKSIIALVLIIVIGITSIPVVALSFAFEDHPFIEEYFGYSKITSVMAHRGSAIRELENTKEALLLAMEEGAKYIELDVVQTLDDEIVILHDLNLKRLAGINRRVEDMTWDELKTISVYSSDKSKSGKIMLLKDLLPLINKETILNIELKPNTNNEYDLAKKVEEIIKTYPRHMICSLNSNCLKYIKEINRKRKTGFIMAVAVGDYINIDFADFFSIEESFVNIDVVEKIHSMDKTVFVWTVNDVDTCAKYQDINVDGIITDIPKEMVKRIYENRMNYSFRMLKKLFSN